MTLAKFTIVAAAGVAFLFTPTQADARGGWETIGSREVNGVLDRDTIVVRGNERFRALRLCAQRRPVRVYDADVEFANGSRQDLRASSLLSPGECSRPFNLAGKRRDIRSVQLSYAKFRVFGKSPRLIVQAR
jgi:endonuclease YncB( thermonuclease family)